MTRLFHRNSFSVHYWCFRESRDAVPRRAAHTTLLSQQTRAVSLQNGIREESTQARSNSRKDFITGNELRLAALNFRPPPLGFDAPRFFNGIVLRRLQRLDQREGKARSFFSG